MSAPEHQSAPARVPTDADADAIYAAHSDGLSQTQAARMLGLDRPSLSRWSRRRGLLWGPVPAAATAQAERIKQGRRDLSEAALADALALRQLLWPEGDQPDARAVRDVAAALASLVSAHLHLDSAVAEAASAGARSMLARLGGQLDLYVRDTYGEDPADAANPTPMGSPRGGY